MRRLLASIGLPTPLLVLALCLYAGLCATTVQGVGLVGEVVADWALPHPPTVYARLDPPTTGAPEARGPFVALQSRPTERIVVGAYEIPLTVNAYTGAMADWPARMARAAVSPGAPSPAGIAAGRVTIVALGALLLYLTHRFLRFHGTGASADAVALLLATDWSFVFYKKVLGGTEILLQAAALLVLWALWSRRWKGGVHGTVAIAIGIGLGLAAKATFAATLVAFGVTAMVMRWDRAALRPPAPVSALRLAGIPLLLCAPLVLAFAHHHWIVDEVAIVSHDTLAVQAARWGQASPDREAAANLWAFLGSPLAWFHGALGAAEVPAFSALRLLGGAVTLLGVGLEWRRRTTSPSAALLRFLSIAAPLQLGLLFAANHDLHHLAQATPTLCLLAALAADRVASGLTPPRSPLRAALTVALVAPLAVAGVRALADTDSVLATLPGSTFTEAGQSALVDLIRRSGATEVVTSDYEVYGMIDARMPEVRFLHTWGAMSRPDRNPAQVLRLARGRWYLSLRPTAPMIYDWHPNTPSLTTLAAAQHLTLTVEGTLEDARGAWATLYRVDGTSEAPTGPTAP